MPTARDLIRRFPLGSFMVLAYALSWAYWLPLLFSGVRVAPGSLATHFPGLLGPALAACIVEWACRGKAGLRLLVGRMVLIARPRWIFFVYSLSPLGLLAAALLVLRVRGVGLPGADDFARFSGLPELGLPLVVLLVFLIGGYGFIAAFVTVGVMAWACLLLIREWRRPRDASLLSVAGLTTVRTT